MKTRNVLIFALMIASSTLAFGQDRNSSVASSRIDKDELNRLRAEARQDINIAKMDPSGSPTQIGRSKNAVDGNFATIPSPYDDKDSFGTNVKFLGSLYAGTVYIYRSCDPQILLDEVMVTLAPDDKCLIHNPPSAPMNQTQIVYDPAWEYTIPKDTIQNVLYIMTNNNPGYDVSGNGTGVSTFMSNYSPVVTIVSDALNDPTALDPSTGQPMNGQYTVSLAPINLHTGTIQANDFFSEYRSYANVPSRGFSRSYWKAVGLPNTVINKLFTRKMSLRFGIRVKVGGAVNLGQYYYTLRMLGN